MYICLYVLLSFGIYVLACVMSLFMYVCLSLFMYFINCISVFVYFCMSLFYGSFMLCISFFLCLRLFRGYVFPSVFNSVCVCCVRYSLYCVSWFVCCLCVLSVVMFVFLAVCLYVCLYCCLAFVLSVFLCLRC